MNNITVLGAGSWGTALAAVAARSGQKVSLWCRREEQAKSIEEKGENERYLPGCILPKEVRATSSLSDALGFSDMWILSVPTQSVRSVLRQIKEINGGRPVSLCNVAKGIETDSLKRISQIVEEEAPWAKYTVLSGPSHAEEVIRGLPTAVVAASDLPDQSRAWQEALNFKSFRIYSSQDVCGVETGGALKNVIAIASGLAQSMKMGDNAVASMVTRGLAEIMRMAVAMGAHPITLAGLAGIGDLMVTAYSHHSRNFRLGVALGEGMTLDQAVASLGQVAEGAYTVKAAIALGKKLSVDLPITEAVYQVLYKNTSPQETIRELLSRDPKPEYPPHVFEGQKVEP
ncbi:MAG: NAD(P)-dependent glycerol-3-phosphate dehydrogenase [Synergistales bacterium]|nr:NAD(P)-dependent glycerol-3-phosphate dehydrogenase [Synergistales bacterium]